MSEFRVLVVDDEAEIRRLLTQALGNEFDASSARDGEDALQQLDQRPCDLVLLDHAMPGLTGLEVLRRIKASHPETRVIMVTASDDLSLVIESIRAGAEDYIIKPIVIDAVKQKIRSFSKQRDLTAENHRLRAELDQRYRFDELLGESPAFVEMLSAIERVSPLQIPILVHGESGTGKELVARAIHRNSPRRNHAFLGINCAALQDSLLASELFGHVRGAFTDAREARKGLFAAADGGTLFLDEIGEISPSFQAQLLRVLQTGEVLPVGSTTPRSADVRIIAATNRDLQEEVERGRFREDLYFRLWKFPIRVPALRERPEDIPVLARAFLQRYNRDLNKNIQGFSEDAIRLLAGYAWPGNVRELENAIERAAILQDGDRIQTHDLLLGRDRHDDTAGAQLLEGDWQEAKRRFEKAYLWKAILAAGGNISLAARTIGMERGNFRDKMNAYGISPRDIRSTES
ncbi:MAG: sigma-54-dependent transcriptional regulator [Thermoanaerobaculia bacterium]